MIQKGRQGCEPTVLKCRISTLASDQETASLDFSKTKKVIYKPSPEKGPGDQGKFKNTSFDKISKSLIMSGMFKNSTYLPNMRLVGFSFTIPY